MRLPLGLTCGLALVAAMAAGAPADSAQTGAAPTDDRPYYWIGVTAFRAPGVSSENLYLRHSLPLLLREHLSGIDMHHFAASELAAYRRALIQRELARLGQTLAALRRERDELLFREIPRPLRQARLADYEKRIAETVDRLAELREMSPEQVTTADVKPIRLKLGEGSGQLLEAPSFSPLTMARSLDVDLLVWGVVEEIQDYLYWEVHALDTFQEKEVYFASNASSREDLYPSLEAASRGLADLAWGRDWASLEVSSSPEGAAVLVDERYRGQAPLSLRYLVPGEHRVSVSAEGYQTEVREVTLSPYSTESLAFTLPKLATDLLSLQSEPEGAAVYRDALRLGDTPLQLPRPEELTRLLLRLPGFRDTPLYLDASAEDVIRVTLEPLLPDPAQLQRRRRDAFYASFGLFALSLPLPFFSYARVNNLYVGVQSAYLAGNNSELVRLIGDWKNAYNTYWATAGISAALFVNVMIQLLRYIAAADREG